MSFVGVSMTIDTDVAVRELHVQNVEPLCLVLELFL